MTAAEPEDPGTAWGVVRVELTRTELIALQETIDWTPIFEGRTEIRDAIREVLRAHEPRPSPLCVDARSLAAFAHWIVPVDVPTTLLRAKLEHALQRTDPDDARG